MNHLLATTLAEWLLGDETNLVRKDNFLMLPIQFKQFDPRKYSDKGFIIGRGKNTYNFKLAADAMYTIMHTPRFVNTYHNVDNLSSCEYAIKNLKGT